MKQRERNKYSKVQKNHPGNHIPTNENKIQKYTKTIRVEEIEFAKDVIFTSNMSAQEEKQPGELHSFSYTAISEHYYLLLENDSTALFFIIS